MPYADPTSEAARESARRANRKYYVANKQREIERSSKWLQENKERVNELSVIRRSVKLPPEKVLWLNAKNRAKAKGIPFNIETTDVEMPSHCPVLGIALKVNTGTAGPNSPSVDRKDPAKGYVKGNVQVISHKANSIKNNATADEVRAVLAYMEREHG